MNSAPRKSLRVGGQDYAITSLRDAAGTEAALRALPYSLRVLLENLLRHADGDTVTEADIQAVLAAGRGEVLPGDVAFRPARVLMQDFTGVPGMVDLAAMRDACAARGGDTRRVNPVIPVDLIVDHSLIIDRAGSDDAMAANVANEYRRNAERYAFLRWAQGSFGNFRVAPPGGGILHQVNLEHIAQVVWTREEGDRTLAYPDTLVGTDSHTTMVNALGVLGWGVGGIEAEAAMLGQPLVFRLPEVVGVRLTGALRPGVTATDLVLTLTQRLRRLGVVECFVEFTGPALDGALTLADRATIANMAPEYGSTCGFFPVDAAVLDYLRRTGRPEAQVALVEAYCREQGLFREPGMPEPTFSRLMEFDLAEAEPSVAGPRRPQDRVPLGRVRESFRDAMRPGSTAEAGWEDGSFGDGAVVIAAITSCTNTSNPALMVGAGLLARKAVARGMAVPGWVKTSLTPGSRVVARYLEASGLQRDLDALGFQLTGFGCGTCGGNSGALDEAVAERIRARDLVACAVLSGNRNFEGRIHPLARAGYLMSPPLVVAFALAGRVTLDLETEPLGADRDGRPVFLRDLWPEAAEIEAVLHGAVTPDLYAGTYARLFEADADWAALPQAGDARFRWNPGSTYIRRPPYFDDLPEGDPPPPALLGARPLLILGDSITTDHISPVSAIPAHAPAGEYLSAHQVPPGEFNAYGARRANHEVMMRGAFANIRLRNAMVPGVEGGFTRHMPSGEAMTIHAAAERYRAEGVPTVVFAGKEYGTGSSRDWAAKGPRLLGVKAVVAESFERIHRSNLVSMGVLPLEFTGGVTRLTLGLDGSEVLDIPDLDAQAGPGAAIRAVLRRADGSTEDLTLHARLDSAYDARVWRAGGILPFMLRRMTAGEIAA